jgi:hypothetical protein
MELKIGGKIFVKINNSTYKITYGRIGECCSCGFNKYHLDCNKVTSKLDLNLTCYTDCAFDIKKTDLFEVDVEINGSEYSFI